MDVAWLPKPISDGGIGADFSILIWNPSPDQPP